MTATIERNEPSPWCGRHGPLLIAEIGGNHEGNFEYAKHLTDLAIGSGADFVKFQAYRGATLVNGRESPDRRAHFERFELTRDQHVALAETCHEAGIGYMASIWDLEMLEWLDPHSEIYKIGSGDLTAYPIVRELARRGKPIILSTGLATLDEVVEAVSFIRRVNTAYENAAKLALLQCTSMYPIKAGEANLRAMDTLREATGLAVGYSDHTEGSLALLVAAARGAQVMEFHFTDTRDGKTFRDHRVSLTRAEVQSLCQQLDCMRELLGDGRKRPLQCEIETDHLTTFRRAVYSTKPLSAGETIQREHLCVLRPNHGIDARRFDTLVGRQASRDYAALEPLEEDSQA